MDLTALAIAAVGVAGTLASALITQRHASRLKLLELQSAERQQIATQEFTAKQEAEKTVRACFVSLNRALRTYNSLLENNYRSLKDGQPLPEDRSRLEEAREAARAALAEAQMVAPWHVLSGARDCASELSRVYQSLEHAAAGAAEQGELLPEVDERLHRIRSQLDGLRHAMRSHLGTVASDGVLPP